MRYLFNLTTLFAVLLLAATSCKDKLKESVKIAVHLPEIAGDTIVVGRTNIISLDGIELGKIKLDSAGKGILEVPVKAPLFAYINAPNLATGFIVMPGDEMKILTKKPGSKLPVTFEGDGAAVNEAYMEAALLRAGSNEIDGVYSFRLNAADFLNAKDSLQKGYDLLLGRLKNNPEVAAGRLDLLKRSTDMHALFYQINFIAGKEPDEIPPSIEEIARKFPVDTISLKAGNFDYGLIAGYFYNEQISSAIYDENEDMDGDTLEAIFATLAERKIKAKQYPKPIEEFLLVKSANAEIASNALTPGLLAFARKLENETSSEDYKSVIRESIARWERIGPGKPAPDFAGITPTGKPLALSDLRGKIVYIDIWATWCGPCLEAFPDSKKVQAEFKGDDRIAFLYVSVDRDTLAWKKMVAGGKVPAGLQMLNNQEAKDFIMNLYNARGIPHYILVDEHGRMITPKAAHPSEGHAREELRKALAASSLAKK